MGQHTILSTEEENKLLNNIISKAKKGIASTKNDVVKAVLKLTKSDPRNLYFSKELTATKWFAQFKRRHRSVFDKYEHIIEMNKESDSDSDGFSSKAKKIGRPKKNSSQSSKETIVKKESNSQHISDDESHSLDDQSDIESKKSILGEDIDKQFAPGSLLEVMDFNQQWYPVKVLEVDYEENEVLVHYQKWSDRYDEWVRMDSNRIRKPNLTSSNHRHNFKVGETVMAIWSYGVKFPAVVQVLHDDDKVDVLFQDGFTKTLRSCKLSKASEEDLKNMSAPREYKIAPPIGSDPVETDLGTKEERREKKRKINILEVFHPQLNKKKKIEESKKVIIKKRKQYNILKPTPMITLKKTNGEETEGKQSTITVKLKKKVKIIRDEEEDNKEKELTIEITKSADTKESPCDSENTKKTEEINDEFDLVIDEPVEKRRRRRKKKAIVLVTPQKRRTTDENDPRWNTDIPAGATPFKFESSDGSARESIIIPDKKLPEGWAKHTMLRRNSTKWDVFLVNPEGRKFRSRNELRLYYQELNEPYPEDNFDFVVGRKQQLIEDSKNRTKIIEPKEVKVIPKIRRRRKKRKLLVTINGKKDEDIKNPEIEQDLENDIPKFKIKPVSSPNQTSNLAETKRIKTLLPKSKTQENDDLKSFSPLTSDASPQALLSLDASLSSSAQTSFNTSTNLQDGFTCPIDGCGKNFRKENLLQMHIKHYHPQYSNLVGSTPNVADLAYARTTGEPLEDSRAEMAENGASFIDRINRFEAERKAARSNEWHVSTVKKPSASDTPVTPANIEGDKQKSSSEYVKVETDITSSTQVPAASIKISKVTSSTSLPLACDRLSELDIVKELSHSSPETTVVKTPGKDEKEKSSIKILLPLRQAALSEDSMELKLDEYSEDELLPSSSNKTTAKILKNDESVSPSKKNKEDDTDKHGEEPDQEKHVLASPTGTSYRFARQRTLEKLHVVPDSTGCGDLSTTDLGKMTKEKDNTAEGSSVDNHTEGPLIEALRKDEIINCTCGYMEEDGLMIQCDLCLCWQHGLCNNISKESEVPEKYICYICQHPARQRKSSRFSHNQDWIREGKLPSLSFRTKNEMELKQREQMLKKSHDLASNLLQLQKVVKSLRVKTHIVQKPDHPKLYLWAKSWGKESDLKKESQEEILNGNEKKSITERVPEPEAVINVEDCQLRLLEHIEDYQQQVYVRLTSLQAQVAALEAEDPDLASDEGPEFYPMTKQTVQMILRDLNTVHKISTIN